MVEGKGGVNCMVTNPFGPEGWAKTIKIDAKLKKNLLYAWTFESETLCRIIISNRPLTKIMKNNYENYRVGPI